MGPLLLEYHPWKSMSDALQRLCPSLDEGHLKLEFGHGPWPALYDCQLKQMNQTGEMLAETNKLTDGFPPSSSPPKH